MLEWCRVCTFPEVKERSDKTGSSHLQSIYRISLSACRPEIRSNLKQIAKPFPTVPLVSGKQSSVIQETPCLQSLKLRSQHWQQKCLKLMSSVGTRIKVLTCCMTYGGKSLDLQMQVSQLSLKSTWKKPSIAEPFGKTDVELEQSFPRDRNYQQW